MQCCCQIPTPKPPPPWRTAIVDVLREAPLTADLDPRSLVFAFGVAGVPEDCQELDKLLQAAKNARDASKQSQRIVLAREVIGPS